MAAVIFNPCAARVSLSRKLIIFFSLIFSLFNYFYLPIFAYLAKISYLWPHLTLLRLCKDIGNFLI